MKLSTDPASIEPALISIADTVSYTGESTWKVKDLLREGVYLAKKSGRRTLIDFQSVKARVANLPNAKFAPPRRISTPHGVARGRVRTLAASASQDSSGEGNEHDAKKNEPRAP